ncbi:MAG: CDP-alcohol phosphatidyltransferase family protein [Lachnospiraceae bacterium]|nr:CDP-alcohol phosphatidyltransferase family protein [Lachnospiraceae bacterium]
MVVTYIDAGGSNDLCCVGFALCLLCCCLLCCCGISGCLLFSGLCDMFDGTVAQHVPRNDPEKKFGIQIDSLCDVVCFCVFPALLTYSMGAKSLLSQVCMAFFVTCGVIRLGYFNVQEEMRQEQTDEKRTSYQGLPVTTTALIFPAVVSLLTYLSVSAAQVLPVLRLLPARCTLQPTAVLRLAT